MSLPTDTFILGRRVELLYRNMLLGQAVSLINASLLTWVATSLLDNPAIYGWWLGAIVIAGWRISQALSFRRTAPAQRSDNARWWRQRALLSAAGAGAVWSAGALLLMSQGNAHLQLLSGLVMSGMVAGAVPILAADRFIFRSYAWPITLAVAFGALGSDPLHIAFVAMSLLFVLTVTRSADFFHGALHDTFRLEHEKDGLLTELARASEISERSNRAKTEFLANVSHELRTPMNGILGMADLLDMEDLSEDQRSYLLPLRSSAKDLLHLINQIIELSALESGQLKIVPNAFAMPDLLDSLLNRETREARAKGLELRLHNDPQLPNILIGDLERLRQVLLNLVGNAIKFTDHGQILVTVKVAGRTSGKIELAFSISDSGPGITPEKLKQLLTSLFVQADGSVIRRHSGTGIGLPIARKLIELLGGKLAVESQVGIGSTFRFTLPFDLPAD